jgi:hypothetical protein
MQASRVIFEPKCSIHLLVVLVLLLGLQRRLGDTVQITLAGLGNAAATLVLVLLEHADLLEGLHDLAVDGAGGVGVVRGARAAVLGGAAVVSIQFVLMRNRVIPVDLPQAADTDGLAHVDVARDGSGADVEPVNVLGRQLLGVCVALDSSPASAAVGIRTRGLDGIDPSCP